MKLALYLQFQLLALLASDLGRGSESGVNSLVDHPAISPHEITLVPTCICCVCFRQLSNFKLFGKLVQLRL